MVDSQGWLLLLLQLPQFGLRFACECPGFKSQRVHENDLSSVIVRYTYGMFQLRVTRITRRKGYAPSRQAPDEGEEHGAAFKSEHPRYPHVCGMRDTDIVGQL